MPQAAPGARQLHVQHWSAARLVLMAVTWECIPVQAPSELPSSTLMLVTRLMDILEMQYREHLAAAKAETDIERPQVLDALISGPSEQPESCS